MLAEIAAALRQLVQWVPPLWRYAHRPRLHVYFDAAETYHTRSVIDAGGSLGYFSHVMVRNDGRDVARNCRGRLMEVWRRNADGTTGRAPGFVAPVVLKWAHELDFGPRDVEHDPPRRLDLCYALAAQPNQLRFFTHPMPAGVQTVFPPGTYIVRVRVDSDSARRAEGVFRIDFTRGWNQIIVAEVASG